MVGYHTQGVPTSGDLENSHNHKKYTINRSSNGSLLISKPVCALMVIGALLLALLSALVVFLFLPRCSSGAPQALIKLKEHSDAIDERLPRSIQPLNYRIQLIPNILEFNLTTSGAVTIAINVTESTSKIIFHAADMKIDPTSVKVKSIKESKLIQVDGQTYEPETQKYTVVLDENLEVGNVYDLEIKFLGKINEHMQGFYKSVYEDSGSNKERLMVSTQFSPTDARRAFPCFDEPSFKATFVVSIARPANMSSLSNMPLREKSVVDVDRRDWVWDNYEETPIMSTYLVGFAVSSLQPFRHSSSEKLFTVWTRLSLMKQARYATDLGPKLLKHFENYFRIPFPLPKIDMVAVPDFGFNAMENWGLITFREKALLFDEESSTINSKRDIAITMAHELGHQWFGNLVTPRWWNDLWLKEGFATYLSYLGVNEVEPTWKILEEFIFAVTQKAFEVDALQSSRPVSFDVQNSNQIRQSFDGISYLKGAALIRMMSSIIGEDRFKNGLITYLRTYQYSNADRDNLWTILSSEISGDIAEGVSFKDLMDSWLLQPGFPVITAVGNPEQNKLQLRQRRFLLSGEVTNGSWYVPISVTTSEVMDFSNTKPTRWLNASDTEVVTVDLAYGEWYLLNIKQTGYYIVNYDEKNWHALISKVMTFVPSIRTQLISDSMDLARANLLSYNIPLRLIKEMAAKDADITFVPYLTAFEKLEFLENMLYTTPAYEKFVTFVNTAFRYAFTNVGFDELPVDDYIKQRIQQLILKWSCKKTGSSCAIHARMAYRKWIVDKQRVSPNVQEVVYCTAIREESDVEWNHAYKAYLTSTSPSEKSILLKALGCTTKPWLLSKYLEFTLRNDSGIRKQDGAAVFESVASNVLGHQIAFNFLRSNWFKLKQHYGEGFKIISKMVSSLPTYMNTAYQLDELEDFRNQNLDTLGTAEQAMDRSIEIVKANVEWMKRSYKAVEDWLTDFNKHFHERR